MELFLALDGSEPLGRAALLIDERHNRIHNETTAFFGFFECIDNKTTASELLKALERTALEKGMNRIIGPIDFSTNYQAGFLVDGYSRPTIMTPYNKNYYPKLVEEAGYKKTVDLYAYIFTKDKPIPEHMRKIDRVVRKKRPELSVKPLTNIPGFKRVDILNKIYNEAFANVWGFVPMMKQEISYLVKSLSSLHHTDLNYVAFSDKTPVGILLTVPDLYSVEASKFRSSSGNFRALSDKAPLKRLRLTVIGVIPAYRGKGIESLLGIRVLEEARDRGYDEIEFSVILENNIESNNLISREFGLEVARTFRIYEKNLNL